MDRVQLKNMAINLRENGLSYNEIIKQLKVPKSTLSFWLKDITLDTQQLGFLKSRMIEAQKRGRFSTAIALKARRVYREKNAFDDAKREFETIVGVGQQKSKTESSDVALFFLGIGLYWAEGGKKGGYFQFVNSDPEMISLMLDWIGKFLKIPRNTLKYRLFIYESYQNDNIEDFWARKINVKREMFQKTMHRFNNRIQRKNQAYKGSFAITITNVAVLRKVLAWQNLLIGYYRHAKVLLP